jgi:hypothetical protein
VVLCIDVLLGFARPKGAEAQTFLLQNWISNNSAKSR